MKIIVYERMYSIHIIKLKLILLWFIETKNAWSLYAVQVGLWNSSRAASGPRTLVYTHICVMKIANLWKASCFGAQSWEFEENHIGKRNVGIEYICLEKLLFYAF